MALVETERGMDDYALALLAQATHQDPPTWAHGDAYVYARHEDDGTVVVAFRGSHSLKDWIHDFDTHPALDPELGWCHSGFLTNVRGVADTIMRDIAGRPAMITGHSKDGAEAKLFAALLVSAARPPVRLTTFGAPRVAASGERAPWRAPFRRARDRLTPSGRSGAGRAARFFASTPPAPARSAASGVRNDHRPSHDAPYQRADGDL